MGSQDSEGSSPGSPNPLDSRMRVGLTCDTKFDQRTEEKGKVRE